MWYSTFHTITCIGYKSFGSYGKATKTNGVYIGVYECSVTILEQNRDSESEDLEIGYQGKLFPSLNIMDLQKGR